MSVLLLGCVFATLPENVFVSSSKLLTPSTHRETDLSPLAVTEISLRLRRSTGWLNRSELFSDRQKPLFKRGMSIPVLASIAAEIDRRRSEPREMLPFFAARQLTLAPAVDLI